MSDLKNECLLIQGDKRGIQKKFEEDKAHLSNEIEKLETLVEESRKNHNNLVEHIKNIEETIAAVTIERNFDISTFNEAKDDGLQNLQIKQNLDSELSKQDEFISTLNASKNRLENKKIDHESQRAKLMDEHGSVMQKMLSLEDKKLALRKAIESSEKKLADCNEKCQYYRRIVEEKTQSGILEKERAMEMEVVQIKSMINQIEQQLGLFSQNSDFSSQENLIENLREKLQEFKICPKIDDNTIALLEKEIQNIQQKISNNEINLDNAERKKEESANEEIFLKEEIPKLNELLAKKTEDLSGKKIENLKKIELKQTLDELHKKIRSLNEKVNSKQFELDNFNSKASKSLDELKEKNRKEVVDLETQISEADKTYGKLKSINDNLNKELQKLEEDQAKLEKDRATLDDMAKKNDKYPSRKPKRTLITPPQKAKKPILQKEPDTPSLTESALRRRKKSFFDSDESDEDLFG